MSSFEKATPTEDLLGLLVQWLTPTTESGAKSASLILKCERKNGTIRYRAGNGPWSDTLEEAVHMAIIRHAEQWRLDIAAPPASERREPR